MIKIDFKNNTYVCPFCGHAQAYVGSAGSAYVGLFSDNAYKNITNEEYGRSSLIVNWFTCSNTDCGRTCITSINRQSGAQQDIYPRFSFINYPKFIPAQIRSDYQEACSIIDASPKAAATLFRRCLQGMIHDFWNINEGNLAKEISALQGKIPVAQWAAIDGLRRIGNIGAHMERDVDLIINVEPHEALVLRGLIELLMDKWYIARHDENQMLEEISHIANSKKAPKR